MIVKCKMCGGDIKFAPGATYGTCEYCGSTSTIPQADDEGKLNRYNRANHFRRQCEFDKAVTAYEKLLEQDDTDAEAHWGAAISRYGIEYVEDPVNKKRIPTCHRMQVASILADADYLAAVENAPDNASRDLYKQQAAEIAEIQKGILAISANEKPYDVFICYKETDENGQRTRDSQWAQEVYYGLTEQGYKVFFSRITLEDKLGQQYEPYIFAALNSAKVMIVIGSKPEYFNAVWVKNEWSRYLSLMIKDRKRLLIPCYRNMDPYDLPDELAVLQSQDMGKIGFIQDLLRGVKKVLDVDQKSEQLKTMHQVVQTAAFDAITPGVVSLMKRVTLFLEDGDFKQASEYLDRILDIDPECAAAYAAKVCVSFNIRKEANLADTTFLYEDNTDWQKALRFASAQQKAIYEGYISKVKERISTQIRNYAYDCAMEMAVNSKVDQEKLESELAAYKSSCSRSNGNKANGNRRQNSQLNENVFKQMVHANEPGNMSEQRLKIAATLFEAIKDSEATECAKQCRTLAEQARQKLIYTNAVTAHNNNRFFPTGLEEIAKIFLSVPLYRDAKVQAQKCIDEAEAIRNDLYSNAVSAMKSAGESSSRWDEARKKLAERELNGYRDVEQLRKQAAKRYDECKAVEEETRHRQAELIRREAEATAAKKKRNAIIGMIVAAMIVITYLVITQVIIPDNKYKKAEQLRANGQYTEAIMVFAELGEYKDAAMQIGATYYAEGEAKRTDGDWNGAVAAFKNASEYSDAAIQIGATYYAEGEAKRTDGDWDGAVAAFANAGAYSDAATQITETRYQQAKDLADKKEYAEAAAILMTIRDYRDVENLLWEGDLAVAAAAREAATQPGKNIILGYYPQTKEGNDSTPIEWLILARDGQKALVISKYGLDAKPYNEDYRAITWENCTLRGWLNDSFLNNAFTAEEQAAILLTNVDNSESQGYSKWNSNSGNNTQDKIFLLSYAEVEQYFGVTYDDGNNMKSRIKPTAYAIQQGAYTSSSDRTAEGEQTGWWWLRSPGYNSDYASRVSTDGSCNSNYVSSGLGSVRPAFWINIDALTF